MPTLGSLINADQVRDLTSFVRKCRSEYRKGTTQPTVHSCVMTWIDNHPEITENFRKHGVIKAYGAYIFEYMLELR